MVFNFIRGELVEIIEWLQQNEDETICWKFPHHNNSIKNGARLIVREGQRALFVSMGALPDNSELPRMVATETPAGRSSTFVGDSFGPGTYNLETRVLPILGRIQGWKHGFQSPFKADVYFISTRRFTNQKWGTQNPLMLRDPEFGPVRLRAFGTYALQVSDPVRFLREIVSTDPSLQTYEITGQLRSIVVAKFTTAISSAGIPVLDMAAQAEKVGELIRGRLNESLAEMGLSVPMFVLENISLPPELEAVLDKRASMGIVGDLGRYTQFQAAEAMRDAAQNPGGGAGAGMGLGAGIVMGQQMAAAFHQAGTPAAGAPPPLPAAAAPWFVAIRGQQAGPFDADGLRARIAAGEVNGQSLVWRQGMTNWAAAATVPEVAALLGAAPPPLPPH
jgi:membrane protease subunit (stomatin/prohibitin family)